MQRRVAPIAINPDPLAAARRQGLRDLGYVDGKNILIEHRYAQGQEDRLPSLVAELVQPKVDILVIPTAPGIRAAKQATKTIPIVMVTQADPVAAGFVESLARPAGNMTGITRLTQDLRGKRLELLKEAVPGVYAERKEAAAEEKPLSPARRTALEKRNATRMAILTKHLPVMAVRTANNETYGDIGPGSAITVFWRGF